MKMVDRMILTVSLCSGSNIVIFDELLLLANHVLEVNDCARLQLKI